MRCCLNATENYISLETQTTADLVELYNLIGKAICEQGEKAFISHVAVVFAEDYKNLKGFSARNFRRMRDFYIAYQERNDLLEIAKTLSWTVNSVILENCESSEEYEFYLALAQLEKLSKLKVMDAIADNLYAKSLVEVASENNKVCDLSRSSKASDTSTTEKRECRGFVTRCRAFLQGGSPPRNVGATLQSFRHLLSLNKFLEMR